jgi:hypothetical protein
MVWSFIHVAIKFLNITPYIMNFEGGLHFTSLGVGAKKYQQKMCIYLKKCYYIWDND